MVASAGGRPKREPALTKYQVLDELGHGGMATVYRAHDKRLARDVAVKVLHPHLKESHEIAHRFAVEAKAVAKLRHPNIVEVFDISAEDEAEQYLVVELVRGDTLRKLLQRKGALPPEVAAALAAELLAALSHAHSQGVIHRDVKPENVLIEHLPESPTSSGGDAPADTGSGEGTGEFVVRHAAADKGTRVRVKLTDFGIAKLLDAQGVTSTGQVLGSPAHMAPEQIEGGDVDGRADVFGLGVLLYECMVGHLPFEGQNPAQVLRRVLDGIYPSAEREMPTIGKVWSSILDRALARDPSMRYPDTASFRDALLAELGRIEGASVPTGRELLEAWFDDPEGWTAAHEEHLIARLCALGAEERRRGDAVAAAADYNRALAYAPNDPQLMRVASTMFRAEARKRVLRRVVPLVGAMAVLGPGSFFVARALTRTPARTPVVTPSAEPSSLASAVPSARGSASPSAVTSATAPVASDRRNVLNIGQPRVVGQPDAGAVSSSRSVKVASIQPANGVYVSIDGGPRVLVSPEGTWKLDRRAHRLLFSCANDLCEPAAQEVPPGEQDMIVSDVVLRIHPAKIVVHGESTHTYGVMEIPNLVISPGVATEIPMVRGDRIVTLFDRVDATAKRQQVQLIANQQRVVEFSAP